MAEQIAFEETISRSEWKAYVKIRTLLGISYVKIISELQNALEKSKTLNGTRQDPLPSMQTIRQWHKNSSAAPPPAPTPAPASQEDQFLNNPIQRQPFFPPPSDRMQQRRQSREDYQVVQPRPSVDFMGQTVVRIKRLTKKVEDFDAALQQSTQQWKDIVTKQMSARRPWRDPDFKHQLESILYSASAAVTSSSDHIFANLARKQPDFSLTKITWDRPYAAQMRAASNSPEAMWQWLQTQQEWSVYRENTTPQDIQQGTLGNCWFIAAMSLIVLQKLPLHQIVMAPDFQAAGIYALRLCIDGRWQVVLVDDKFPVYNDQLLFSKASKKQLWVPLIEKALAKAYGCYEALVAGQPREGLSTLTGEPVESLLLPKLGEQDEIDETWAHIYSAADRNYLIGAVCGRIGDDPTAYEAIGLVDKHVYAILELYQGPNDNRTGRPLRLVCLRNPWGKSDWKGHWHDASSKWLNFRGQLPHDKQQEGTFWMEFSDMLHFFHSVDICKLRPEWKESRFTAPFYRRSNRSCLITLLTVVDGTTSVEMMLHQLGLRSKPAKQRDPLDLNIMLCTVESPTGREADLAPLEMIGISNDGDSRSFVQAGDFPLPERQYAVVAFSFKAALNRKEDLYSISVHSSKPIFAETVTVPSEFLGKTLVTYVLAHGKKTTLGNGLNLYKATQIAGAFVVVVENTHTTAHQYLKLEAQGSQGLKADVRGSFITEDLISPMTRRVVQIFTPADDDKNKEESSSTTYLKMSICYRLANSQESKHDYATRHVPPIKEDCLALLVSVPIQHVDAI